MLKLGLPHVNVLSKVIITTTTTTTTTTTVCKYYDLYHHSFIIMMLTIFISCSNYILSSYISYFLLSLIYLSNQSYHITSLYLSIYIYNNTITSQIDILPNYGRLPFNLDFFTECLNLSPLLRYLDATIPTNNTGNDNVGYDDENNNNNSNNDNNKNDDKNKSTTNFTTTTKLQQKFHKLTSSLCELLDDYGLVSYLPMSIEDGSMVGRILAATDNANGYR